MYFLSAQHILVLDLVSPPCLLNTLVTFNTIPSSGRVWECFEGENMEEGAKVSGKLAFVRDTVVYKHTCFYPS